MLKINCIHVNVWRGRGAMKFQRPQTEHSLFGPISGKYYRYWYYQNRAWQNSFLIPGSEVEGGRKAHLSNPLFSSYSENKAVIMGSSLRIINQQKKIASQWLTWWEGKEGARGASWLCCFLPATANEIPCQGGTCHTSSTSKSIALDYHAA